MANRSALAMHENQSIQRIRQDTWIQKYNIKTLQVKMFTMKSITGKQPFTNVDGKGNRGTWTFLSLVHYFSGEKKSVLNNAQSRNQQREASCNRL